MQLYNFPSEYYNSFHCKFMYAINIAPQNSQKCEYCQNVFFQYIGTQAWCLDCKKAIKIIQQEIKVVPKMYQSNCKDKQSSAQIKIKSYFNEFCNKYGGISDNEEMSYLFHQAMELKTKKGITTKNYRQNSAVVVYVYFKDIHRLSIKEFCKKNQIQLKSFNKSYLVYQKILKEKKLSPIPFSPQDQLKQLKRQDDFKIQYTHSEQSEPDQKSPNNETRRVEYFRHGPRQVYFGELNSSDDRNTKFEQDQLARLQPPLGPNENTPIQKVMLDSIRLSHESRVFLRVVFDSFFGSLLYQEKKTMLVKELVQQVIQMYKNFRHIVQSSNQYRHISLQSSINDNNFYKYLFYLVLKKISHGISQAKYRKIIQQSTGETIKANLLKQVIKLLESKEETVSFSGDSMFFVQNSGTTGSEFVKIEEKE